MKNEEPKKGRFVIGGLLILFGIYFLFRNTGWWNFDLPYHVFNWYSFLFVIGLIVFLNSKRKTLGGVMIACGIFGFVQELLPWLDFGNFFFPALLVFLGVLIIFRRKRPSHRYSEVIGGENTGVNPGDKLDEQAFFGGSDTKFTSKQFMGGDYIALFGGSNIDLSACELGAPTVTIDCVNIFGGGRFIVPKNWDIQIDTFSLFGGFKVSPAADQNTTNATGGTLIIKGVALFGGSKIIRV